MILYYTGTGNSEYVAKRIGELIGDSTRNLFERLKTKDYSAVDSEKPFVFVSPTYCWQLPHIVRDWVENTEFSGNKNAYFVLTCGDSIGNAGKFAERLCEKKGFQYMGCAQIIMPENYIAMFDAPQEKKALEIIEKSQSAIDAAANCIKNGEQIPSKKVGVREKIISSSFFNDSFYKVFVHSDKYYTADSCIGCGLCVSVCPLNSIELKDGRPKWNGNCTHCMACICRCPKEAIEYGNKSRKKPRYTCPR
ncbi:MAG: EFR1 family ferrodoxin [Eubacterium sp.]|nr:EFR1 family ferrodoxin [Eubacterium sp.]